MGQGVVLKQLVINRNSSCSDEQLTPPYAACSKHQKPKPTLQHKSQGFYVELLQQPL
jgi:hypothetical protein